MGNKKDSLLDIIQKRAIKEWLDEFETSEVRRLLKEDGKKVL